MFSSFIKLAVRSLIKHKSYTLINLFGLVGGLASALVLILFAYQELQFDRLHEKREQVHLVYKERIAPLGTQLVYDTWVPMLQALRESYPAIADGTRLYTMPVSIRLADRNAEEPITFADPGLFNLFNLPIKGGDGTRQLEDKSNVILSSETASRLFGDGDPLGKLIHLQAYGASFDFVVSGVLEDIPVNSSIRPGMIVSFENAMQIEYFTQAGWNNSFLETFVLLKNQTDPIQLESLFPSLVKKVYDEETANRMKFKLLPFAEYHNHFTNSNRFAYIMLIIALIILTVAIINYVNLATVRSLERAKEIGLRKAMGATRFGVAGQFLGESFALTGLSFILALGLLQAVLPFVNDTLGTSLTLNLKESPALGFIAVSLFGMIGLLSGSFPAFFVSHFNIIESLKGKMQSNPRGAGPKKALIILQFSLAVALLFCTLIIYEQVGFMKGHDLGFNKENVVVIPTDADNMVDPRNARTRVASLKKELLQQSGVSHVSSSDIVPSDISQAGHTMVRPEGWTEEQPFRILRVYVDESYFELYDIKLLEGQPFSDRIAAVDTLVRNFSMVNESAMKAFGWTSCEGMKIGTSNQVVGLVPDHHYTNLAEAVEPTIFVYRPTENQASAFLSVRFNAPANALIPLLEAKWKTLDESRLFTYFFVDKNFERLYQSDERNMRIISWFTGLTIIIACLGLLGLISFTITQKTKEIGIRKVLGSSVGQILLLLNKEFVMLMLVAVAIALPAAYFLTTRWLEDFALRIAIPWWAFVVVSAVTLLLALLTTSIRAYTAAMANPVVSLRSE